jgi:hypothetical protein
MLKVEPWRVGRKVVTESHNSEDAAPQHCFHIKKITDSNGGERGVWLTCPHWRSIASSLYPSRWYIPSPAHHKNCRSNLDRKESKRRRMTCPERTRSAKESPQLGLDLLLGLMERLLLQYKD